MSSRDEKEVLADLAELCTTDGYIHALAFLVFHGSVLLVAEDGPKPEDFERLHSSDRLTGTEVATLAGLMLKRPISTALPTADALQSLIDRTLALLRELHDVLLAPVFEQFGAALAAGGLKSPLGTGPMLREAIFYGPDSAYSFQYRDLAALRYTRDEQWLRTHKHFSIADAVRVVQAAQKVQNEKLSETLSAMRTMHPDKWSILPAFCFTLDEVARESGLAAPTVEAVLAAFAVERHERNDGFNALHDFNVITARPVLRIEAGGYALLDQNALAQALYESPIYWMTADSDYSDAALRNRGLFTEEFCRQRLEKVFGPDHVYSNVRILESKAKAVGEIDVLVLFGNRAIVLQAKSKRLTLEARRGNDQALKEDFKKSVQESYDQAVCCARHLSDSGVTLEDSRSRTIVVPGGLKEIQIMCVVADHYPSLAFQAREFLKQTIEGPISPPLVLDVFALDAITEMLDTPLRFLSYVNRRSKFADRVIATHELMVLGYHLKKNLWLDDQLSGVALDDSMSTDLDIAMAARREGFPGARTPPGILTRLAATPIGCLIEQIEADPSPGAVELGFLLLMLGEDTVLGLSTALDRALSDSLRDHQNHDLTINIDAVRSGLTIHCNEGPRETAEPLLLWHCTRRKYAHRAATWSGVCLCPDDGTIRFGVLLDHPWSPDAALDDATKDLGPAQPLAGAVRVVGKRIGRNQPCPCGSGRKFKKCCGK